MSDTGGTGEPTDLFNQWLAHRGGQPIEPEVEELRLPTHLAPVTPDVESGLPDQHATAASILAALQPAEPEAEAEADAVADQADPAPPSPVAAEPAAVPAPPAVAPAPARSVSDTVQALPQTIFFKPRAGTQRILGVLLLIFIGLTGLAVWWAYAERTTIPSAIAAIAAAVTAVIWATRSSSAPARLTLHGSDLEIVRSGSRALFDLAHTRVEVKGSPGRRGWRVLLLRRSMSPYVVDGSMVDAREFMYVLRYFHPEV